MTKVGLISDTHGYWDERFSQHFCECDLILHAGDIGDLKVAERLAQIAPLRAVYGNIDDHKVRETYPEVESFNIEEVKVLMMHIGGYPGRYERKARLLLKKAFSDGEAVKLFVSGHSHILKVMPDKHFGLLHINPGAAGISGWHAVRTLITLEVEGSNMRNLNVIELYS